MRVISFKVDEDEYVSFKKFIKNRHLNFTKFLRPIVQEVVSKQSLPNEYTRYTSQKDAELYQAIKNVIVEYEKKRL